MKPEDELRLSFYRETAVLNEAHHVFLVQHVETGQIYVKKTVEQYDLHIYKSLQAESYRGIPMIHELIQTDHELVIIEEYISGSTIQARLEQGTLSEELARRIIMDLCDILAPLHAHVPPIVHRDIKGSNLIIDERGQVYLLDFDASKVVRADRPRDTVLMGTQEYAAPEQYGFAPSDARTDIYALGVLFNVMLTGSFPKDQLAEGYSGEIIRKCTALEPDKRYPSVIALKKALHRRRPGLFHAFWQEMPGVRSGKVSTAAIWVLWILFLIYFTLTTDYVQQGGDGLCSGGTLWLIRLIVFLSLGLTSFYLVNYKGWRDKFPFKKKTNVLIEALRITLGAALLFIIPLFFLPGQ